MPSQKRTFHFNSDLFILSYRHQRHLLRSYRAHAELPAVEQSKTNKKKVEKVNGLILD